jgi:hypothetical protein
MKTYTDQDLSAIPVEMVERILIYIKENARICKLLLSERGDLKFQKRVLTLAYEKNISKLMKSGTMLKDDAEYIYAFTLTGCVGAIQKWLNDDLKKSPRFMAEMIVSFTSLLPGLMLQR